MPTSGMLLCKPSSPVKLLMSRLLVALSLLVLLPSSAWTARLPAGLAPLGVLGDFSEVDQNILFLTLQENLSLHFTLASQKAFEQARDVAFDEMDFEECTEDQCFAIIQQVLQVDYLFLFNISRSDDFTQLSLTAINRDSARMVRTATCEGCSLAQLNEKISEVVLRMLEQLQQTDELLQEPPSLAQTPPASPAGETVDASDAPDETDAAADRSTSGTSASEALYPELHLQFGACNSFLFNLTPMQDDVHPYYDVHFETGRAFGFSNKWSLQHSFSFLTCLAPVTGVEHAGEGFVQVGGDGEAQSFSLMFERERRFRSLEGLLGIGISHYALYFDFYDPYNETNGSYDFDQGVVTTMMSLKYSPTERIYLKLDTLFLFFGLTNQETVMTLNGTETSYEIKRVQIEAMLRIGFIL